MVSNLRSPLLFSSVLSFTYKLDDHRHLTGPKKKAAVTHDRARVSKNSAPARESFGARVRLRPRAPRSAHRPSRQTTPLLFAGALAPILLASSGRRPRPPNAAICRIPAGSIVDAFPSRSPKQRLGNPRPHSHN